MRLRVDGMTLAGMAILMLFAINIVRGVVGDRVMAPNFTPVVRNPPAATTATEAVAESGGDTAAEPAWHTMTAAPYDTYFLTQGLHGQSYGHLAVDIAAGNGSTIRAIINGTVTSTGYDQWGNTYIQIENDIYTVLYLHGLYSLAVGEVVTAGQPIGTESNIGYTLDYYGRSCAGRDCGYHTHLNVFDKRLGANIDPLTLIPANR